MEYSIPDSRAVQKEQAVKALRQIIEAITEAVAIAGDQGAPAGTLYAAMMQFGCSLDQFAQIMSGLVALDKLDKRGNLYFAKGGK